MPQNDGMSTIDRIKMSEKALKRAFHDVPAAKPGVVFNPRKLDVGGIQQLDPLQRRIGIQQVQRTTAPEDHKLRQFPVEHTFEKADHIVADLFDH